VEQAADENAPNAAVGRSAWQRSAQQAAPRHRLLFWGCLAREARSVVQTLYKHAYFCRASAGKTALILGAATGDSALRLKSGRKRPFCLGMGPRRLLTLTSALLLAATACNQPPATVAPETAALHPKKAKEGKNSHADKGADDAKTDDAKTDDSPQKYTVPFAWENSKAEPLALTARFLKEAFEDNKTYMEHGPKFFSTFADCRAPRATRRHLLGLACPTAGLGRDQRRTTITRCETSGNQLAGDEGSIEYGVEHLNTPLLLIIGHTGCEAVEGRDGRHLEAQQAVASSDQELANPATHAR